MLEEIAINICFNHSESVIEFGSFFGRSTACICIGLLKNNSFKHEGNFFYTYDSFKSDINGGFLKHVLSYAKSNKLEHLLDYNGSKVDFYKIFYHFCKSYIDSGILIPEQVSLSNSFSKPGSIKLIHIDSPKFYKDFKIILFRFFPKLKLGSFVIFQDFFYHWSASLIAVCGYMISEGFLSIERTAASSLLCKVQKEFNLHDILKIDLKMEKDQSVSCLIDSAIDEVNKINMDRKEVFYPRLTMAKFQWLFENKEFNNAGNEIINYFCKGNTINDSLFNDFIDMINHGFSIKKLYNIDYNNNN